MYDVDPKRIYALDRVMKDPVCVERMDRMLKAMGRDRSSVIIMDSERIPETIKEAGWVVDTRQGDVGGLDCPDVVFSTFTWPTPQERAAVLKSDLYKECLNAFTSGGGLATYNAPHFSQAFLGISPIHHYERRPEWKPEHVCWSLHDLHSAWGCFHCCAYCARGRMYVIMLNVEEFIDHVDQLMEEYPWQKVFRYDVEQDILTIEPEYGASKILVEHYAELEDKYIILFSKSANVDFLLDLDHKGHTIMLWTLSTHEVSRNIEPMTGTMEERIEAARKCQEAGYPVRFKCKPIIPVRNWREQITYMLETLFDNVEPENISMELLFTHGGVKELDLLIGLSEFDDEVIAACEEAEKSTWSGAANGPRPFPFEVKRDVYRHFLKEAKRLSPSTPVTLCAETQRMWEACGDLIDAKPWDYVCNCGPHCIPGIKSIENVEGPDAERIAEAIKLGAIPKKA